MNTLGYTELSVLEFVSVFVFHKIKHTKFCAIQVPE